ncbi:MAG: hypothetical protein HY096_12890 [Nitrospinae bacterium]|nr:hypothetical protein [Nitrospinota bacterium]
MKEKVIKKNYKRTGKRKRFTLRNFFPDLPEGWALYSEYDIESRKAFYFFYASKQYKEKFLNGDEDFIYNFTTVRLK